MITRVRLAGPVFDLWFACKSIVLCVSLWNMDYVVVCFTKLLGNLIGIGMG